MDAEVSVKAWEQRYGFQRTVWDVQSEHYQTNLLSAVDKRRKNLLCKMRQQSSERKYLIKCLFSQNIMLSQLNFVTKKGYVITKQRWMR